MTAGADQPTGAADLLVRPLPARMLLWLGGGLLAMTVAFCAIHSRLTAQSVSFAASLAWAASILVPWLIVLEAGKRRLLHAGRLDPAFLAIALAAAFVASVGIQAAYLAALSGPVSIAGIAWRRLPAVALVALPLVAADLFLRRRSPLASNDSDLDPTLLQQADWIKGAGNYVEVRFAGRTRVYRLSMERCERLLGDRFVRVHRSIIVNGAGIVDIEKEAGGTFVRLRDGTRHRVGDRYRHRLGD